MNLADKHLEIWLPAYLCGRIKARRERPAKGTQHVIVCIADHFEPQHLALSDGQVRADAQHGRADLKEASARIATWVRGYPETFSRFMDADGCRPQHTWFYPPHHDHRFLDDLLELCRSGFGEIEMHLHHNRMDPFPETAESLRAKITGCIDDFSRRGGIFCLPGGRKTFAFVHGDWSLDNAAGQSVCGVNNEISLLASLGCYADFTFPSLGITQPQMINRMYYALDDPGRAKSYNSGKEVRAGGQTQGDLMIVSGIIGARRQRGRGLFGWVIESSNIDASELPTRGRVDYWIRNAVRITGRPEWLFLKLHTHGAPPENARVLLGEPLAAMYDYLIRQYNDGARYALHFVTARQMYNIVKAAEAGKSGNPGHYRDFVIPPYVYLNQRGEFR